MTRSQCFPIIDQMYVDTQTKIQYHIIKVKYVLDNIEEFTLVDSNKRIYKVTSEWMVANYKSKRLSFLRQLTNSLGYEIGRGWESIYVVGN